VALAPGIKVSGRTCCQEGSSAPPALHVDEDVHDGEEEEGQPGRHQHVRDGPGVGSEISGQFCNTFDKFAKYLLIVCEMFVK
jgi:hypothetical protein